MDARVAREAPPDDARAIMIIPPDLLSAEALRGIIEDFVTSEGTDYGLEEVPLEDKVRAVRSQIDRGDVEIVFDPKTESIDLVRRR